MAAVRPDEGRTVVRLSQVPRAVREAEADAFVKAANLRGLEALSFKLRAVSVLSDCTLEVPTWKAERVLRGKRVGGTIAKDLFR